MTLTPDGYPILIEENVSGFSYWLLLFTGQDPSAGRVEEVIGYCVNKEKKTKMSTLRYQISRNIARLLPDKLYLSIKFRTHMGYWMDWRNPKTFSEKLQWLKVYDRHPEYTEMVDKVAAKDYVAGIIGKEYVIPTLAVYNSADEIDFDALPNQFVLKCTHDSGGLVVCKDKSKLDVNEAREKLRKGLKRTYIVQNREYPYKNVPRRIIAELYMEDESGELKDYKFFCFDGKVQCFKIDFDRFSIHRANYYDKNGNLLKFGEADFPPDYDRKINLPSNIKEMIAVAETLSAGFVFIRVDLYNVQGQIYFGEMTFFPASGMGRFTPEEWDYKLGECIKLPHNTKGRW